MILENILKLYLDYDSVLGPYKIKNNRLIIILNNTNKSKGEKGKLKTISYPKVIMELFLNRKLTLDETIHHKDGDVTNNDISNLEILDRKTHIKLDVIRRKEIVDVCAYCNSNIEIKVSQINSKKKAWFCNSKCAGKYGREVQLGLREPIIIDKKSKIEYYKLSSYEFDSHISHQRGMI